ncbi:GDSL-type esterase/lipase family protein [Halobacillus litoralis]|uniref:GDSL-type esterase/lipase family protein n=1 Tax=Halobacillus litoralis TaxID=45668 RepID=UPI001CFF5119|nr:GDSL-type esterase/lipase family protein [Halobacillus litoralis]
MVAVGDSIPYGYNLEKDNSQPPDGSFPSLIAKKRNLEVTNLSIPGITSSELLGAVKSNEIYREALKEADYVIVYIGGNDLLNIVKQNGGLDGVELEDAAPVIRDLLYNVYETILEIDELTDGKILVYNIYNPYPAAGDKLDTPLAYINQQYASLVKLLKHFTSVSLVNANKAFRGHPEYIIKGDVHPTKKGQEVLAKLALKHVK